MKAIPRLQINLQYQYGWSDQVDYAHTLPPGLNRQVVQAISHYKNEPAWMRSLRLRALAIFFKKPLPTWGADLSGLDFSAITYYATTLTQPATSWDDLPQDIKTTYEKIGIPQAERKYLAGVKSQYDSEVIYGSLQKALQKQGVIFQSMDEGLKSHPDIVKQYFGTIVPPADNKFAALNAAVWSGGSFVYVPAGVKVTLPLQAYFRINRSQMGQFERTLIVAEEGSEVSYVEGCTAPSYTTNSLHSAVVEIIVKPGARVRYTTIQNWSANVYNLVTKRARVEKEGIMEWVDANLGSRTTMKYPSCYLVGQGAKCDILSLAFAGSGQNQDTGGKCFHLAPHTTSQIVAKSVASGSGITSYRGLVEIAKGAHGAKSSVKCDALMLHPTSRSYTYPHIKIDEYDCSATHEAVTGKIQKDQLFYLQSRGLDETTAQSLIVNGFIEPVVKQLPLEYAIELNRLIELEMTGSVG